MTIFFISIGIFLMVVCVLEGGYYAYHSYLSPKTKKVKRRFRATSSFAPPLAKSKEEQLEVLRRRNTSSLAWLERLSAGVPRLDVIDRMILQANSSLSVGVFLLVSATSAVVGLAASSMYNLGLWGALICTLGGGSLPFLYLSYRRKKRMDDFQRQLPDALDLVSRALRAGHAFSVGMKMVGDEFPDPIGPEFARAVEEISYGIDVPEALKNLSHRIDCVDLSFFVTSLIVQRETGGNLAEILEAISRLIRQRFELLGRVKALSAEGKLSAIVLFLLPIGMGLLLWRLNPSYMELLVTDPFGQNMLASASVMMLVGFFVIRKMTTINP